MWLRIKLKWCMVVWCESRFLLILSGAMCLSLSVRHGAKEMTTTVIKFRWWNDKNAQTLTCVKIQETSYQPTLCCFLAQCRLMVQRCWIFTRVCVSALHNSCILIVCGKPLEPIVQAKLNLLSGQAVLVCSTARKRQLLCNIYWIFTLYKRFWYLPL